MRAAVRGRADRRAARTLATRSTKLRHQAYSSRGTRATLRRHGITAVIPEPADQAGRRKRRGSRGGRSPAFDADDYRGRNGFSRPRHPLRQARHQPPRCGRPPRHHDLDQGIVRH